MKLTIEKNPESIKRYQHVRPAPRWASSTCGLPCPGTVRSCTLERGHRGPHVAHTKFGRVVAVWDRTAQIQSPGSGRKLGKPKPTPGKGRDRGVAVVLKMIWGRLTSGSFSLEDAFLLLLALAMVGFAIDWALRIIGFY